MAEKVGFHAWCGQSPTTLFTGPLKFPQFINMTYSIIKQSQFITPTARYIAIAIYRSNSKHLHLKISFTIINFMIS